MRGLITVLVVCAVLLTVSASYGQGLYYYGSPPAVSWTSPPYGISTYTYSTGPYVTGPTYWVSPGFTYPSYRTYWYGRPRYTRAPVHYHWGW